MAYVAQKDAQGNVTGLALSNPSIGNVSALSYDIPVPQQGEVFLVDGQLAIRQGNSINILSGVYGLGGEGAGIDPQQVAQQLGIDYSKLSNFNLGDLVSPGTGLTKGIVGDYKTGQTGFDTQQQLQSNIQAFADAVKQYGTTANTDPTLQNRTGGTGSNVGTTVTPPPGTAATSGGTVNAALSGGQTSGQYQILNLASMAKYQPNQYQRLPDGSVVLNPGVQPIAGTVKPYAGGGGSTAQYQILDLASMAKYQPNQYDRLPDGAVVLKPGVQPIAGTVKPYSGSGTTGGVGGGTPGSGGTGTPGAGGTTYNTGNPQLDGILNSMQTYLNTLIQQGKQINPNIELTPAIIKQFTDQAISEIDPYYAGLFKAIKDDVTHNLDSLQKQYELQKQDAEAQFKSSLGTTQENAAGAGLAFSGVRGQAEQNLVQGTNRSLAQAGNQAANQAYNALHNAETQVGSRNIADFGLPSFDTAVATTAGRGGFTGTTAPSYFTPSNITGSLEYAKAGDIRNLADFYKQQEVQRRTINPLV